MKSILILGGYGQTGRALAPLLLAETDCRLILAGRNPARGQSLADALNLQAGKPCVTVAQADAADPDSLARAFAGIDLVIVASSTAAQVETVARAALAARADYLDIQYSTAKLATLTRLAPDITAAGACFITDGGFHPGLPAALVRYAATRFDRLERANVASVINVDWAALDLGQETQEEFVREFIGFSSRVFRDGRWRELGLLAMMKPLNVTFGPPYGRRACLPMGLSEMDALPEQIPALRETGFFIAGFNPVADWFASPVVMLGLKIAPRRLLSPMTRLMFWSMCRFARPPFGTLLRLEASGIAAGRLQTMMMNLSHEDGYALTAIPVAACVRQWLAGARRPGLWYQAQFVEPEPFLRDMAHMGVRINMEESAPEMPQIRPA